uniref:Uncharacterized protein n=1 Tax=Rhizophora mucronata TaxID=61149 RepID=A0A2P2LA97_RHIMU
MCWDRVNVKAMDDQGFVKLRLKISPVPWQQ